MIGFISKHRVPARCFFLCLIIPQNPVKVNIYCKTIETKECLFHPLSGFQTLSPACFVSVVSIVSRRVAILWEFDFKNLRFLYKANKFSLFVAQYRVYFCIFRLQVSRAGVLSVWMYLGADFWVDLG